MATRNRPFFIQYDIPKVDGVDVCANPSDEFWARGCVRITKSNWAVMESRLPGVYRLLNRLARSGVIWFAMPFDVSDSKDGESMRAMLLQNARQEIAETMRGIRETMDLAETRFADESDTNYRRRRRQLVAAANTMQRRMQEKLARIGKAAKDFGISEFDLEADSHLSAVELMASNMHARAAAFAEMHGILTRQGGTGSALARSIEAGETPAGIGSDFLRDIGEEDAADDVNASFGSSWD